MAASPLRLEAAGAVGTLELDVNRRFFIRYVSSQPSANLLRVLDFGCGGGEIVRHLRSAGIDCYGVDISLGRLRGTRTGERMLEDGIVRKIRRNGRVPFEDETFDLIVSNQVFEHVEDLDAVLAELRRVLRSGGRMYHHFPSREVLREGHCRIPLSHRLPSGRARTTYMATMRRLGFGARTPADSPRGWANHWSAYLDGSCYYRPYRELERAFGRHFQIVHHEIDYCRFRAGERGLVAWLLARDALSGTWERIFRRVAFMAIELRPAEETP